MRALLVVSSGFAETGAEGAARQRELLEVCRDAGIRIVGPNCLGVLNTSPEVRLNATFAPPVAVPGGVGFMSQSGGLGIAIIEAASRLGVGLSSFVSVGNKCDLSGNDFLQYWEQDPDTKLALLYLESFGNPRKFARIARRVAATKPILAVKSGRSAAGARATSSHTGAMLSASDVTVDALFEQAGVIRTDTMHELFDVAALLSAQPRPARRPGGDRHQRRWPRDPVRGRLPGELAWRSWSFRLTSEPGSPSSCPPGAALGNPIDMIATASAADYRRTLQTLADADACDAIITIFVPALVKPQPADVADRDSRVRAGQSRRRDRCGVHGQRRCPARAVLGAECAYPATSFPRTPRARWHWPSATAAGAHETWARCRGSRAFDRSRRRRSSARSSRSDEAWLSPACVAQLFDCYGLPLIATRVVSDAEQAVAAANELGVPVALKASAPGLVHKTDAGGVRLGLEGADAVRAAAGEIEHAVTRAGHRLDGLVVQPMAPRGVELIVGVVHDHSFGPVLACGAGGTTAELVSDVAVRITPVTDVQAREMVRSLRTFPLLDGYRGAPRCDLAAIEDVLLRVSAMVEAHPEIVELDCNPLIAGPDGAVIVDARVRVETAAPPRPMPSLEA